MSDNCPVCQIELNVKRRTQNPNLSNNAYDCPRCGCFYFRFRETNLDLMGARSHAHGSDWRFILSHSIRKMQKDGSEVALDNDLIEAILKQSLPTPAEQKDILVRWIGDNIKAGGEYLRVPRLGILAIIGARTETEYPFILSYLSNEHVISNIPLTMIDEKVNTRGKVTLTFKGWKYYEELKIGSTDSRKAFMAMKYGDKELDKIVDDHFRPAVAETGFELYRLDEEPKAGLIDDRLRVEIRNSRFLISDLTHDNNGAYWEAGYAEGLGKPVIYTCKKKKFNEDKPHFDTNHHLTVIWDEKEIEKAVELLKATIRATLPDEAKLSDD